MRQSDIDITSDLAFDQAATGGGAYVSFIGRRVSSGNDYLLKAPVSKPVDRSRPTWSERSAVPRPFSARRRSRASPVNPGDLLRVRFQVSGTTRLDPAREGLASGTAEPTTWLAHGLGRDPGVLQGAGDLGVLLYVSGSWTGTLPGISLDNLDVVTPD